MYIWRVGWCWERDDAGGQREEEEREREIKIEERNREKWKKLDFMKIFTKIIVKFITCIVEITIKYNNF